jgi:hypothetical protein
MPRPPHVPGPIASFPVNGTAARRSSSVPPERPANRWPPGLPQLNPMSFLGRLGECFGSSTARSGLGSSTSVASQVSGGLTRAPPWMASCREPKVSSTKVVLSSALIMIHNLNAGNGASVHQSGTLPSNVSLASLAGACKIPEIRLDADPMGKMRGPRGRPGSREELTEMAGKERQSRGAKAVVFGWGSMRTIFGLHTIIRVSLSPPQSVAKSQERGFADLVILMPSRLESEANKSFTHNFLSTRQAILSSSSSSLSAVRLPRPQSRKVSLFWSWRLRRCLALNTDSA